MNGRRVDRLQKPATMASGVKLPYGLNIMRERELVGMFCHAFLFGLLWRREGTNLLATEALTVEALVYLQVMSAYEPRDQNSELSFFVYEFISDLALLKAPANNLFDFRSK